MSKRRVDRHASEIGAGHTAGHVKMLEDADPASVEVDPILAGQSLSLTGAIVALKMPEIQTHYPPVGT